MLQWLRTKLNPAQSVISRDSGEVYSTARRYASHVSAYNEIPVVRRGVDLIVNGASSLGFDVTSKLNGVGVVSIRKAKLETLIQFSPNPYQDIERFKRLIYLDLILEGNAYIHFDGAFMYHLPAVNVKVVTDPKTLVAYYEYNSTIRFNPEEIIPVSDNGSDSIFRGTSRAKTFLELINIRGEMLEFQRNFFKNNAVPGLVIQSPSVLGQKIKDRLIENWVREYNPKRGGKRPLILDGGLEVKALGEGKFKELDFEGSVRSIDESVLLALGVPPILLFGGNNANITPNQKLMWVETILPLARLVVSAFERYFGYDISVDTSGAEALRPELNIQAAYLGTLVNTGVITPNEARLELRYPKDPSPESDKLRIPANITGSAAKPSGSKDDTND